MTEGVDPVVIPGAKERLGEILGVLDRIIDHVLAVVWTSSDSTTHLEYVRIKFFDRAFNSLKGIKLLLEHDHWELAAPLVRQMFELVVNLEEIHGASDPEEAARRFRKFAAFQDVRHQMAGLRYNIETGRRTVDEKPTLDDLERFCIFAFPEFVKRQKKDGELEWYQSWCGYTIRELSKRSNQPIRRRQYETVFLWLSAFAHGAPVAVAGDFAEATRDEPLDVARHVESDDQRILEVISLTLTFFLELWIACCPPIAPMPAAVPGEIEILKDAFRSE